MTVGSLTAKQTIDDNARFCKEGERVPVYAITMGVGTILEAKSIMLLATGEAKAEAVAGAIETLPHTNFTHLPQLSRTKCPSAFANRRRPDRNAAVVHRTGATATRHDRRAPPGLVVFA